MESIPYLALVSAIAALALASYFFSTVKAAPAGNDRMVFLMSEIQKKHLLRFKIEVPMPISHYVVATLKEQ